MFLHIFAIPRFNLWLYYDFTLHFDILISLSDGQGRVKYWKIEYLKNTTYITIPWNEKILHNFSPQGKK